MTSNWISYPPRTLFGTAVLFLLSFLSFNGQSVSALDDVHADNDEAHSQKAMGCAERPEDYFCLSPDIIDGGPFKCGLLPFLKGPTLKKICEAPAPATCDGYRYGSAADVCFESCEPYKKYKFYKYERTCKSLSRQPEKKEKHCKSNDKISGGRVCFKACGTCPSNPLVDAAVDVLGDCASPLDSYNCDNDRNKALAWFYDVNNHPGDMTDLQALKERLVVAILYSCFGAPGTLSGWMTNNNHCSWDGLDCEAGDGYLTGLDLYYKSLIGTIASEVEALTSLKSLSFSENSLTGTVPSQISNLTNLLYMSLSSNSLTGTVPSQISNLVNLETMSLSSNSLTGTVPSQISNLVNLKSMSLSWNSLTGTVPSQISNLVNLKSMSLSSNSLTGSLPSQISNLVNLETMSLSSNSLSGSLPSQISNLSNLEYMYISWNSLTGSLPSELGSMNGLKYLYLYKNSLTGSLPSELGSMNGLQYLYLYDNDIIGPVPTEVAELCLSSLDMDCRLGLDW